MWLIGLSPVSTLQNQSRSVNKALISVFCVKFVITYVRSFIYHNIQNINLAYSFGIGFGCQLLSVSRVPFTVPCTPVSSKENTVPLKTSYSLFIEELYIPYGELLYIPYGGILYGKNYNNNL